MAKKTRPTKLRVVPPTKDDPPRPVEHTHDLTIAMAKDAADRVAMIGRRVRTSCDADTIRVALLLLDHITSAEGVVSTVPHKGGGFDVIFTQDKKNKTLLSFNPRT